MVAILKCVNFVLNTIANNFVDIFGHYPSKHSLQFIYFLHIEKFLLEGHRRQLEILLSEAIQYSLFS